MKKIKSVENHTYYTGDLPAGCIYCLEGSKLVLFLTGLCSNPPYCSWYCPLSEKRKNFDVIFANDVEVLEDSDIFKEAELMEAKGAGITGGDPLIKLDRTLNYIKILKDNFGSKFHLHLYTAGNNIENKKVLKDLADAGLDEIRFHPDENNWHKIEWALSTSMDVGAEIPVLPDKYAEIMKFTKYLSEINAKFLNLNELEMCDTNSESLKLHHYSLKDISTVKGSHEVAFKVLKDASDLNLNIHYCTAFVKGGVQLQNRMKRRAKNTRMAFEKISDEGLFIKGVIFSQNQNNKHGLEKLIDVLITKFKIPKDLICFQASKNRIEIHEDYIPKVADYIKENGLICGIVEEWSGINRFDVTFTPY